MSIFFNPLKAFRKCRDIECSLAQKEELLKLCEEKAKLLKEKIKTDQKILEKIRKKLNKKRK